VKAVATRGTKPKPTALKQLEGNPGKRKINKNEPKPAVKIPKCPEWLEPEAKAEWERRSKQLLTLGVLTEVDEVAFAGYCQAYARWREAEEFISKHGSIVKTPSGYWQQVPQVAIANKSLMLVIRFCEQFGMTPSSRSHLAVESPEAGANDMMEFILSGVK
jgi:P27 family predicted phage terminase small subunit